MPRSLRPVVLIAAALVLAAVSGYLVLRDVNAGLGAGLLVASLAVLVLAVLSAGDSAPDDDG